jgi:hypothetical protein
LRNLLCLLIGLLGTLYGTTQELVKVQDLGLWTGLKLEKEVREDFTLHLAPEVRINESVSQLDQLFSELGAEYKINKNFQLQGDGRYIINYKPDRTYSQDLRYNFDIQYKGQFKERFAFKYRVRFQRRHKNFFHPVGGGSDAAFRHRVAVDFQMNDLHRLQLSGEMFREISLHENPHFEKFRLQFADDLSTSLGTFEWAVAMERELDTVAPLTYYILRLYYTIPL